jgi:hypothetical protein
MVARKYFFITRPLCSCAGAAALCVPALKLSCPVA